MTREVVNEASTMTVSAKFYGLSNVASTPSTVRYRIKDVTNDRVVKDWTTVTPAQSIEIAISAEDNEIYLDSTRPFKRFEERVLVIQANYDTETQYTEEIRYLIKNLRGFDS
jgi:hypothetical protein